MSHDRKTLRYRLRPGEETAMIQEGRGIVIRRVETDAWATVRSVVIQTAGHGITLSGRAVRRFNDLGCFPALLKEGDAVVIKRFPYGAGARLVLDVEVEDGVPLAKLRAKEFYS